MTVHLVKARYSDYDWSDERVLGIFDSLERAQTCKDAFEKERTIFVNTPSPLSDDEVDLYYADKLGKKKEEDYEKWMRRQQDEQDFDVIIIRSFELNEIYAHRYY